MGEGSIPRRPIRSGQTNNQLWSRFFWEYRCLPLLKKKCKCWIKADPNMLPSIVSARVLLDRVKLLKIEQGSLHLMQLIRRCNCHKRVPVYVFEYQIRVLS